MAARPPVLTLGAQRGGQAGRLRSALCISCLFTRMYRRYCAAPPPLGLKGVCSPAPLAAAVMSAPQPKESETAFVGADKEEEEERRTGEGEDEEKAFSSESDQLIPHGTSTEREGNSSMQRAAKWRNVVAFWLFGLCNNFPYVIMLSAAFDILSHLEGKREEGSAGQSLMDGMDNLTNGSSRSPGSCSAVFNETTNSSHFKPRYCNTVGTSVILLADILPTFIIKLTLPYLMNFFPYWLRIFSAVFFSALSFIMVGLSLNEALVIFGVVCASISSGFGEITFLSFTAHYDKSTVSGWSSGTGAAGIGAALLYAAMRTFLSAKVTILLQLVMPAIMLLAYLCLLGKPGKVLPQSSSDEEESERLLNRQLSGPQTRRAKLKFINRQEAKFYWEHVKYIPHLLRYMVPLFFVYISEYMINQGLFELLYYPNTHLGSICLDQRDQYRWYQVVYQLGVFISRSSIFFFHIKWFWILAVLQMVNFAVFFLEAVLTFVPSFWITFLAVLYEGLLGGGVYANAFYSLSKQVPKVHREFSMGVASVADSTGIVGAGIASIFIHNFICTHYVNQ